MALSWQDINSDNQTLTINGKDKKQRLLPLHPLVLPLFNQNREELSGHQLHPSEPIFLNRLGTAIEQKLCHIFNFFTTLFEITPQFFSF